MNKNIFPIILILLQFGAGLVYAASRDWRMAIYFISAAVLNLAVTV